MRHTPLFNDLGIWNQLVVADSDIAFALIRCAREKWHLQLFPEI
jgi:hypothetical protein